MRYVLAALVAALILATPAHAQRDTARAGIEKAKAAGIYIDGPATEEAMARAPEGSCANDPTQDSCPKAYGVVRSPSYENADGSVSFAPATPLAKTSRKARARIAQWPSLCNMWMHADAPYKSAGYAQSRSKTYCSPSVTLVEHYSWLFKRYNNVWHQMVVRGERVPGGEYSTLHPTWQCDGSPHRYWRAYAEGWALVNGLWYWDSRERFNWLYCG